MLIECPHCEAKVDGEVIATHVKPWDPDGNPFEIKTSLLKCPSCDYALLAQRQLYDDGPDESGWSIPIRVWPKPDEEPDWDLPDLVHSSILEARKCHKATAYLACAVMCGRTLEAIFLEYKIRNKNLRVGLKKLLEKGVIDKKIHEWGEAIRIHRNIGAHAKEEKISKRNAKELLEFTEAICDYVFVLTDKFDRFMKRFEKRKKK